VNALCIGRCGDFIRSILVTVVLLAHPAVTHAATAATSACEAHAARAHQILLADSMDNWEPLDDRTVLIWTKHSARAHLVRLDRAVVGLADAAMIYLVDADRDGRISPCGRDGIVIGAGAEVRQVARIISIELLSAKRTAELDSGAQAVRQDSLRI
jgi:hypothetical protein